MRRNLSLVRLLAGGAAALALAAAPSATAAPLALRWPAPVLTDPVTIDVTEVNAIEHLDPTRDYVLRLPTDRSLEAPGGLSVTGGRNVVIVGGTISIPWQGDGATANTRRGLMLKGQTGTVHVEGVLIAGADLAEGINLDEPLGATVQLQNLRIEDPHVRSSGELAVHHPDVLQTWSGPGVLRINGLTATTGYQGLFLTPNQYGPMPTQPWELSRINLVGLEGSGYLLWKSPALRVRASDMLITPAPGRPLSQTVWTSLDTWPGIGLGSSFDTDFVPRGTAGVAYATPLSMRAGADAVTDANHSRARSVASSR